ncbi:MAG: class I SAM-dependent methyltransferase [Desulfobacteraceae bacterium]|jgi:2-polyprenyl-6-hydroxyphenyl methylase/3-demethylubiquinone-9 3-methyltransferase
MKQSKLTFSFGKNWKNYLKSVDKEEVNKAKDDIEEWLDKNYVSGKTILDIGSGSGIHSLAFYLLDAKTVYSFDFDEYSVEATRSLWEKEGKPKNWIVSHGSILDKEYLKSFNEDFDIVYSWGVLHHTGAMWEAINSSINLVNPGGKLWISLYAKGPRYSKDLALKQRYNSASQIGKKWMISKKIGRNMFSRLRHFKNPFTWNEKKSRGMNVYHDIVDWLGGLPYEVASENEVLGVCREKGLILERIKVNGEGACSIYVFSLPCNVQKT